MRRFVLGTAGHVDHGKTALVKALTSVDTDRLPEEKKRGLTIELGFAPLPLGPDLTAGIVDVPGHQKFVQTMVAGVNGVDALLLVVAADEGIQPQTQEHIEIAHYLGISEAICALTKTDLVEKGDIPQRIREIQETLAPTTLKKAEIFPVSSSRLTGISRLQEALTRLGKRIVDHRQPPPALSIPVDRVFSQTGFGTIVTGTLSGEPLQEGEKLETWPGGNIFTVRSIEVFNERLKKLEPASRVAINLSGANKSQISRSSLLARPGSLRTTEKIHVVSTWKKGFEPQKGDSFVLLTGTSSHEARWFPFQKGRSDLGELRIQSPIAVFPKQKFILRRPSPAETLGGGYVLDPHPDQKLKDARLDVVFKSSPMERLDLWLQAKEKVYSIPEIGMRLGAQKNTLSIESGPKNIVWLDEKQIVHQSVFLRISEKLLAELKKEGVLPFSHVEKVSPALKNLHLRNRVLEHLRNAQSCEIHNGEIRLPNQGQNTQHPVVKHLETYGLTPPTLNILAQELNVETKELSKLLQDLEREGVVSRLSHKLYCHSASLMKVKRSLQKHFQGQAELTMGEWKELTKLSRKYAVPLLEHFDRQRITLCKPDRIRIAGPNLRS